VTGLVGHSCALAPPAPATIAKTAAARTAFLMLPSLCAGNAGQKALRSALFWRTTQPYSTYRLSLCLPATTVLPIVRNEKFGTFSFYEQLLDKRTCLCLQHTGFENRAPAVGTTPVI
jgi:hypothetical protein